MIGTAMSFGAGSPCWASWRTFRSTASRPAVRSACALLVRALAKAFEGKDHDDLVFPGPDGSYMRRTRASKGSKSWFVTALAECGLDPITPHDLRHTAASLAISSGANVKAVQRMLGHASAARTHDVYAYLRDDDLTALADGLDDAARAADVFNLWGPAAF